MRVNNKKKKEERIITFNVWRLMRTSTQIKSAELVTEWQVNWRGYLQNVYDFLLVLCVLCVFREFVHTFFTQFGCSAPTSPLYLYFRGVFSLLEHGKCSYLSLTFSFHYFFQRKCFCSRKRFLWKKWRVSCCFPE